MFGIITFQGSTLHFAMVALIVIPTFLSMGYSMSFMGDVVSYPVVYRRFHQINTSTTIGQVKSHNSLIQGVVISLYTLGALVGSLSVIPLGNKLGRRSMTFYGALITLVGTILQTTSFGIAQLCVARSESRCESRGTLLTRKCCSALVSASCPPLSPVGRPRPTDRETGVALSSSVV